MAETSDSEKLVEEPEIKIDIVKCDAYFKFIKEVCRVVRDAVDAVFTDKDEEKKAVIKSKLLIKEDDELVPDSKAIQQCILVCDRVAVDHLDTAFGRVNFSRRSKLRIHDDGILYPSPETAHRYYDLENSVPFVKVRDDVFRQLEREHWNSVGPEKKILAVNHLEIPAVARLWELSSEKRMELWQKFKNMHNSTTPPRSSK
jgi:hypothetical protein